MTTRSLALIVLVTAALAMPALGNEDLPLVFKDDFSKGADRWEPTDPAAWTLGKDGDRAVWGLNKRKSNYQPTVRSPHNVALVKDLELADTVITFQVKSTLDTGGHRDCCVFFNWQDPEHFYYVHLGAKPDPASGQIMIVDGAPRRACRTASCEPLAPPARAKEPGRMPGGKTLS